MRVSSVAAEMTLNHFDFFVKLDVPYVRTETTKHVRNIACRISRSSLI